MGWLDVAINEAVSIFVTIFRIVFQAGQIGAARADQARRANQSQQPYTPDVLEPQLIISPTPSPRPALSPALLDFRYKFFIGCGLVLFFFGWCNPALNPLVLLGMGCVVVGLVLRSKHDAPPAVPVYSIAPLNRSSVPVYRLHLPKSIPWDSSKAEQFMSQLLTNFGSMTFQIIAERDAISWQLLDLRSDYNEAFVVRTIRAIYPEADVQTALYQAKTFTEPFHRFVVKAKPLVPIFPAPLVRARELKDVDPLVNLTQAASDLEDGETLLYTLAVTGFARDAQKQGERLITTSDVGTADFLSLGGAIDAMARKATGTDRTAAYADDLMREMRVKLQNPLYHALLTIQIDAPTQERVGVLLSAATHVFQFAKARFNAVDLYLPEWEKPIAVADASGSQQTDTLGVLEAWLTNRSQLWQELLFILEPAELAALWHVPNKNFTASDITWIHGKQTQLPAIMRGKRDGVCLGSNRYAGRDEPVYMPQVDRATHMAIIGKTGTGKSNLLHRLIHQDIQAGRGVSVVDPHGTLVRDVLRWSIPLEREPDVIVLDLANEAFPPPLNLLAVPKGLGERGAVAQVMAILEKFGSFDDTVTVAPTLRAALSTLWHEETPTLRDVPRLFKDPNYCNRLLETLDSPAAEEFWEAYDTKSVGQQDQLSSPVVHRISDFYGNNVVYPMLCHPDPLPLSTFMNQNKIILMSLQADETRLPPQEQRLLGAILISQLQMAAMSGAIATRPYYLYIDEVQHFVTTSLPTMFSEARKYGLALIVANQYLHQLAGNTLSAVVNNVGAVMAFQCGLDDAKVLEPYMQPQFEAEDLTHLDKYNAAVFMRYLDQTQAAFGVMTEPPLPKTETKDMEAANQRAEHIRQHSVQQYTPKSRQDVLNWLKARYPRKRRAGGDDGEEGFYEPSP
ncbi:MAG: type IV secretion system DNA-binding domain-containing protein [Anaerolineae bacterium]